MQTEKHTDELLLPEPSSFKAEICNEKLRRYLSSCTDQIQAERSKNLLFYLE
jgi:hypothetical protein